MKDNDQRLGGYSSLEEAGIVDGVELTVVHDPYSKSSAQEHVLKTRQILGFPGESSSSFVVSPGRVFSTVFGSKPNAKNNGKNSSSSDPDKVNDELVDYSLTTFTATPDIRELVGVNLPSVNPAIKELYLSQWNPPLPHLQLQGHLLYLVLTTMDGKSYHIISKTNGFYISNSTDAKFDPSPRNIDGKSYMSHSLISLIQKLSPPVINRIKSMGQTLNQVDPATLIQPTNSFLASPWIVEQPPQSLKPDITRTQSSGLLQSAQEKDWNEDLQSTRELPIVDEDGKIIFQEKLLRERLLNKLQFDFTEAATKGAMDIVKGNITSLNPNEPYPTQIFLSKGIFYSFALDGMGTFAADGGDEAARVAAGKDRLNVNTVNELDIKGIYPLSTVIVDYCGRRIVCQTPVPGIFRDASGGGDDNDDDKEGENSGNIIVHGSVDGRDQIAHNEKFGELFSKVSKACHLKSHIIFDNTGNEFKFDTPYETKGLQGTDGRRYILDLYRLTPPDLSFIETSPSSYPHKMCLLRPELVEEWWRHEVRTAFTKREAKKPQNEEEEQAERVAQEKILEDLSQKCRLNPDVHLDIESIPDQYKNQFKADQEEVRMVCQFLTNTAIPKFIEDITEGTISTPLDAIQLTNVLHKRGINLRYLGLLYKLAMESQANTKLEVLTRLVLIESISRAAKHLLSRFTDQVAIELVPFVYVHFWNLLFTKDGDNITIDSMDTKLYPDSRRALSKVQELTTESVQQLLQSEVSSRFGLSLPSDWRSQLTPLSLFRNLSLQIGLQWATTVVEKVTNGDHLDVSDLINIVPTVKSSIVKSQLANDAMEQGRLSLIHDDKQAGIELLNESISLHEQVYGLIHTEVARAYSQLAVSYHELEDNKKACEYGLKAVLLSERCNGTDSAETIFLLLNLAFYEHSNSNSLVSLQITKHALRLWNMIVGSGHPDTLTTMNNVGTILQAIKNFKYSQQWLDATLAMNEKLHGPDHISAGTIHYHLANSYLMQNEMNKAINSLRKSLEIFSKNLGPDDENTIECKASLERWVKVAVSRAKFEKALPELKIRPKSNLVSSSLNGAPKVSGKPLGERSVDELLEYINGDSSKSSKKKTKSKNKKRK